MMNSVLNMMNSVLKTRNFALKVMNFAAPDEDGRMSIPAGVCEFHCANPISVAGSHVATFGYVSRGDLPCRPIVF